MDAANIVGITLFSSWKPPHEFTAKELDQFKRGDDAAWPALPPKREMTRFVWTPPLASDWGIGEPFSLSARRTPPDELDIIWLYDDPPPPLLPKLIAIPYIKGEIIPPQEWLVEHWVPMDGQATLFQGDGGEGKSTIAQQLQSSCGTALPWLGLRVMECVSVGFYTEDRKKDLLRRQAAIDAAYDGQACLSTGKIHLFPRRDLDNELIQFTKTGAPETRPFFEQVREAALDLRAKLIVLDVSVDLYGGLENERRQVRAFARLLNGLAGAIDGAVFLTAHLSVAGIKSGGGHSGSTDWSNAFRSRLYLGRPKNGKDTDGEEPADTNSRLIVRKKANFATTGETIKLHWERGAFLPDNNGTSGPSQSVDDVFLALLDAMMAEGQNVSPKKKAGNCASALFMTRPPNDRGGYQRADFDRAMQSLLKDRKIKIVPYGPRSKGNERLVRCETEDLS